MASGIYKIQNLVNGHIYIGSAVDIKKRWAAHISAFKRGKHKNHHLQNAWDKYNAESFEFSIIEECPKENLFEREQFFIDTLSPQYNICKVAGNWLGMKHSVETLAKLSAAASNMSDETRAKISKAKKGVKKPPFSIEHRANMSAAQKGRIISAEHRAKLSASIKNWWAKKIATP